MSESQKRISGALLAGAALIAGALLMRTTTTPQAATGQDTVTVGVAPERSAIKVTDENGDGVPDWQEALLVTGALNIASTTTGYKEPETMTEKFALEFFQDMVRAENYGAFGDSKEELVLAASNRLAAQTVDELLDVSDILTSSDNSPEALAAYGEAVAGITTLYPDNSEENEAVILERALRSQNPKDLEGLDVKVTIYENILRDTKALSVPTTVQKQHLDLLNSYQAVLSDIQAMRSAFTDPMLTLLRMKRYQEDTLGMASSFRNLYKKLSAEGATWESGSVVAPFIAIE
jgi:hypothetical protein